MNPSPELCAFTKQSEGLALKAYPDNGAYSIGYGHRSDAITAETVWTAEQAENAFEWDMQQVAVEIAKFVKVPLTQGQFDCLCDFTFNEGSGRLEGSMLLSALNVGNYARVPLELYRVDPETGEEHGWIFAGGKKDEGLIARRKGEIEFWNGGCPIQSAAVQEATA